MNISRILLCKFVCFSKIPISDAILWYVEKRLNLAPILDAWNIWRKLLILSLVSNRTMIFLFLHIPLRQTPKIRMSHRSWGLHRQKPRQNYVFSDFFLLIYSILQNVSPYKSWGSLIMEFEEITIENIFIFILLYAEINPFWVRWIYFSFFKITIFYDIIW